LGPVLGYIVPLGQQTLIAEFKWLPELDFKKRVAGDYLWAKMVCKF
jgi:hypothetical protein